MHKHPSEITGVLLNTATFTNQQVDLAAANFFFGNNGTGKSTIAQTLREEQGAGVQWNPKRQAADYLIHLYDRQFVEDNFRSSEALQGVFTLDERNISIETQLATANKELSEQTVAEGAARAAKDDRAETKRKLRAATIEECWDKSAAIRRRFPKTQEGFKKNKPSFFEQISSVNSPRAHDIDELAASYDLAFDEDARTYEEMSLVAVALPVSDLPGKVIVSSADAPYAQFVKKLGAIDWISEGHEEFGAAAQDDCPYCAQKLPADFEMQLAACFDASYQKELEALRTFVNSYRTATKILVSIPLSHEMKERFPELDLSTYDTQVQLLRAQIENNARALDEKLNRPSKEVTLIDLDPIVEEINMSMATANAMIIAHNQIVGNQKSQQDVCRRRVWELLAKTCQTRLEHFQVEYARLEEERAEFEAIEEAAASEAKGLREQIRDLSGQTVNTTAAMESINKLLRDSGFQGFSLHEKPGQANVYEVIRPDGSIAHHLSEGERNFIAFLYFYFQLHGSLTSEGESRQRIVIIDDPVSSMDTGAIFIIAALVRELVDICLNNWKKTPGTDERDHIKQIFVLTHNAYFFREASYNRVKDYELASLFLVQKRDNQSEVIQCVRNCKHAPSQLENYTPVTNAYATLWDEYRELDNPMPLLNVMRRILEHYFLQLCGYDGEDLRTRILVGNRDRFVTTNDDGTEDLTKLRQAESILAYLNHEMTGLGDDLYYVEHSANSAELRYVFRQIFEHMGQEQHYNMMTRGSTDFKAPPSQVGAQQTTIRTI